MAQNNPPPDFDNIAAATATLNTELPRPRALQGAELNQAVLDRLDNMEARFNRRFDGIDGRLDDIDGRLDDIDGRLDGIDGRLDGIDDRLDGIDGRFDGIDGRFDGIDGRFDGIDGRFDGIDGRLDSIQTELRRNSNDTIRIENSQRYSSHSRATLLPLRSLRTGDLIPNCPATAAQIGRLTRPEAIRILQELGLPTVGNAAALRDAVQEQFLLTQ